MEKELNNQTNDIIGHCGLYCSKCPRFIKGKCQGCRSNNPSWCTVKPCNIENDYSTCAECTIVEDVSGCKKYNPFIIKFGEFISSTSRRKCIEMIKEKGKDEFIRYMSDNNLVSIKKRSSK